MFYTSRFINDGKFLSIQLFLLKSFKVEKIPRQISAEEVRKIPHIGWNTISVNLNTDHKILKNLINAEKNNHFYYFVHSYCALPENNKNEVINTNKIA